MPYGECKVYSDGGHFIAIPPTTRPYKPRKKPVEELITVEAGAEITETGGEVTDEKNEPVSVTESCDDKESETVQNTSQKPCESAKIERTMTRRELFEELYVKNMSLTRYRRKAEILKGMLPYFKTEEAAQTYVDTQMRRKIRNLIARRVRMMRKVNLQDFNFFVTFTFSDELHTEESFKSGLKSCLKNFSVRKGWKYVGVWERSPKKKRLHFHGLFYIPDGTMPGMLLDVNDYNFNTRRRQITHQNTYFNERFGRSDFEDLDLQNLGSAIAYIMKYLEKSGEKIVYSKGLPQYFISDIMDEDVVCPYGVDDKKLLLYDDFNCWDEGCLVGRVSKDVIKQLRKSN